MYLVSDCSQTVSIRGNHFEFVAGDAICTEYSYKYTVGEFADIAAGRGRIARLLERYSKPVRGDVFRSATLSVSRILGGDHELGHAAY